MVLSGHDVSNVLMPGLQTLVAIGGHLPFVAVNNGLNSK